MLGLSTAVVGVASVVVVVASIVVAAVGGALVVNEDATFLAPDEQPTITTYLLVQGLGRYDFNVHKS